jgi:TolB-like protein
MGGDSLSRPTVIVLPFRNLGIDPDAKAQVTSLVYKELERTIFQPVASEAVLNSLRSNRIRETSQLTTAAAQTLAKELGTPWILLGSIDFYDEKEKIEVGFSARLLNVGSGEIVWAETRYSTGNEHAGLLGLGAITSVQRLAAIELGELFKSLRKMTIQNPNFFRNPDLGDTSRPGVVLIPFDNAGNDPLTNQIFDNIMLATMIKRGLRVIEPGIVGEALLTLESSPNGQIDRGTLDTLAATFNADYFFTGYLSKCQNLTRSDIEAIPEVEIEARLVEPLAGKVIWARRVEHSGRDYTKIFHLGTIYSPGKLLQRTAEELVDNFPREIRFASNPQ